MAGRAFYRSPSCELSLVDAGAVQRDRDRWGWVQQVGFPARFPGFQAGADGAVDAAGGRTHHLDVDNRLPREGRHVQGAADGGAKWGVPWSLPSAYRRRPAVSRLGDPLSAGLSAVAGQVPAGRGGGRCAAGVPGRGPLCWRGRRCAAVAHRGPLSSPWWAGQVPSEGSWPCWEEPRWASARARHSSSTGRPARLTSRCRRRASPSEGRPLRVLPGRRVGGPRAPLILQPQLWGVASAFVVAAAGAGLAAPSPV